MQEFVIERRRLIATAIAGSVALGMVRAVMGPSPAIAYTPPAVRPRVRDVNDAQCTVLESIERLIEDDGSFHELLSNAITLLRRISEELATLSEEDRAALLPVPGRFFGAIQDAMLNPPDLPLETIGDYVVYISQAANDVVSILEIIMANEGGDEQVLALFSSFQAINLLNAALTGFASPV